jgi:type III restriction enzyme
MLDHIIQEKKNAWLKSDECTVVDLIRYIRGQAYLRDAQTEAIETYLFLKICGKNKPLWQLFSEGFFAQGNDLAQADIPQKALAYLSSHQNARALFDFAQQKNGSGLCFPQLESQIKANPASIDYHALIRCIFYQVDYADYLMSLPMGAGKTFLMAAFIYLDLYFASNEPDNKSFSHNFLVLVPSGLKSSIVPSLKTIESFDPSWVLPEPAAGRLKKLLKFDVLDEQKTARKSNRARNPNAQKVNACFPNPFGHVFVVNAEKVILESFRFNSRTEMEPEVEETDTTNDLKRLLGQIPNLSILIDEVHHAATDDIKLRQAVNYWHSKGNITTVIGFSGTPYLQQAEKVKAGNIELKFSRITNTVYYYPLVTAVKNFLKKPTVKIGQNLDRFQIIQKGIEDFDHQYQHLVYQKGTLPKLAIYCSSIEILEEEVYPFLIGELKINPLEILRFHKGNKKYPQPPGSELEFRSLDLPLSRKRYILLVQVGKEGWDCPSLTGVILSQKSESQKNMVLQTSCRCLRQADKGREETALIWLNKENAEILNKQLKQEQNTSIEELNQARRIDAHPAERPSGIDYLQIQVIDFFQMRIIYKEHDKESAPDPSLQLRFLFRNIDHYKISALIVTSGLDDMDRGETETVGASGMAVASFHQWMFDISKESFGLLPFTHLQFYKAELYEIFSAVTYEKEGIRFFNEQFDLPVLQSSIRLAFSKSRKLQADVEVIPAEAQLPRVGNVNAEQHLVTTTGGTLRIHSVNHVNAVSSIGDGEDEKADEEVNSLVLKSKSKTFHDLPYEQERNGSNAFDLRILTDTLQLERLKDLNLEIYFADDRNLTGFIIDCFEEADGHWKNIGKYSPDFLIIRRQKKDKIYKILLVQTRRSVSKVLQKKKEFVEKHFIHFNNKNSGYQRFDFICLVESAGRDQSIYQLTHRITRFFNI